MSKRLIALNLLLAALCGLAGWRLWDNRKRALEAQERFLASKVPPAPAPVILIPPPPQQVSAANYLDVASQLLLSKDRNPTVIVEVAPPKPMPALPRVYGVMSLGDVPRVVMAPAKGGQQKSYVPGEQIGEFKLVQVTQRGVIFEWEGKQVGGTFDDLKDDTAEKQQSAQSGGVPNPSAAPVKSVSTVTSVGATSPKGPGEFITGSTDTKACVPGDNTPAGAVSDGFRKVVSKTPFGEICRWEKIN